MTIPTQTHVPVNQFSRLDWFELRKSKTFLSEEEIVTILSYKVAQQVIQEGVEDPSEPLMMSAWLSEAYPDQHSQQLINYLLYTSGWASQSYCSQLFRRECFGWIEEVELATPCDCPIYEGEKDHSSVCTFDYEEVVMLTSLGQKFITRLVETYLKTV